MARCCTHKEHTHKKKPAEQQIRQQPRPHLACAERDVVDHHLVVVALALHASGTAADGGEARHRHQHMGRDIADHEALLGAAAQRGVLDVLGHGLLHPINGPGESKGAGAGGGKHRSAHASQSGNERIRCNARNAPARKRPPPSATQPAQATHAPPQGAA